MSLDSVGMPFFPKSLPLNPRFFVYSPMTGMRDDVRKKPNIATGSNIDIVRCTSALDT